VIRLRTSRVVQLPNACQVTPLMILVEWGTPTTRPAAATRLTKRSAKRSKSCSKRVPTSIAELPRARALADALRGRNATLRFRMAENEVDPEPNDNSGTTPMD
jgi:hypothetical protein